jgi:hypothetical protein
MGLFCKTFDDCGVGLARIGKHAPEKSEEARLLKTWNRPMIEFHDIRLQSVSVTIEV